MAGEGSSMFFTVQGACVECLTLSVVLWLLPAEENTKLQANVLVVLSRTLLGEGGRARGRSASLQSTCP